MAAPTLNLNLHSRQSDAFQSLATEILYGGAAGGGKSHLMRIAPIIWCSEIPGLQVYLFRRLSDDLFKNHMSGPGSFPELLAPWIDAGLVTYNGSKNFLEWWNGSRIWLCHCQHEKDKIKYQGAEIHVLLIDELTHFTETIYRFLRGRCRLGGLKVPIKYRDMFPRILCGSNPGGMGHNFVRRMFVNQGPMVIKPQSKLEGGMLRQFIPAKLSDNPTLEDNDPSYLQRLEGLGNPAIVKAMRDGDWNIVAGGALDDVWHEDLRVPRFRIPSGWRIDRSLDWGSARPFSVGWWATASGEEIELPHGRRWCPVKGSLIRFDEMYGSNELGSNEGVRRPARQVARDIIARETRLMTDGWISRYAEPGPADNAISSTQDEESDSIANRMKSEGVHWIESDKSPGSRVNGLELLRGRIVASKTGDGPGIYFMEHCEVAHATLPVLPRDERKPEDVDSSAEDHCYDEVRYRVLSARKQYATDIAVSFAN